MDLGPGAESGQITTFSIGNQENLTVQAFSRYSPHLGQRIPTGSPLRGQRKGSRKRGSNDYSNKHSKKGSNEHSGNIVMNIVKRDISDCAAIENS